MRSGRLSTLQAALVVARRDFTAILLGRSFIFFLLAPFFPVVVALMAGGVGEKVQQNNARADLGIVMQAADVETMLAARAKLAPHLTWSLPEMTVVRRLAPGERSDPQAELRRSNVAAIVSGTPARPILTGTPERIAQWEGPVSLLAATATGHGPSAYPDVRHDQVVTSNADSRRSRSVTAQAAQTLLFLLTMLLAGMVLSNLVEEKGNKIIEILAAAIPMDAVFLGKLFAMLAISFVAIAVWTAVGGTVLAFGPPLPTLAAPAVGWPAFFALGVIYFAMAYLLLGSLFLSIGSMAATVRDVQTLSFPVTMLQLVVFFFAGYAMSQPGTAVEWAAILVPFSSPFAMLARAATQPALWPHLAALAWQVLWVGLIIRAGAKLFRSRVMKSGNAGRPKRPGLLARLGLRAAKA
jgi:ABC-2 type transport system permease protein